MKAVDIDKLYENFMKNFLASNSKLSSEEIEEKLPELYEEFSNKEYFELDYLTPKTYYLDKINNLIDILKLHSTNNVEISDYLIDALINYTPEDDIMTLLDNSLDSKLVCLAVKVLRDKDSNKPLLRYIDMLKDDKTDITAKELMIEVLEDNANEIYIPLLKALGDKLFDGGLEILSYVTIKDEKITNLLTDMLIKNPSRIPEYANYIAKYGDERALDALIVCIENEKINYNDFKELKIAIEALGGSYNKNRDFSWDINYIKLTDNKND